MISRHCKTITIVKQSSDAVLVMKAVGFVRQSGIAITIANRFRFRCTYDTMQ